MHKGITKLFVKHHVNSDQVKSVQWFYRLILFVVYSTKTYNSPN